MTYQKIARFLGSRRCFQLIVGLLVVQAVWIALSGRYPMAFDEDFHLGIIRLYAHHLLPFWSSQPVGGDAYGAVARDPSYLYHYLMSFPYWLISQFTHDTTIQVLILRFINIGLFASGLVLFRRLLTRTFASPALLNLSCLIFILIPITPLLAAQINYDNLLLPLMALSLGLTLRFTDEVRAHKRINGRLLLSLLSLCLLASLVKFAFLPVFLAILIYLGVELRQAFPKARKFWLSLGFGLTTMTRATRRGLLLLVVIAAVLFGERYGINLVRYHTPLPGCNKVLSVQQCSHYGPWIRDYNASLANVHGPRSPITFTADWFYGMWLRMFFAVDGPATGFQTRGPLYVPGIAAIVFAALSAAAVLRYARELLGRRHAPLLWLSLLAAGTYLLALWLDEYREFIHTGQPMAINGRYLLPILLPLLVLAALAWHRALAGRPKLKLLAAGVATLCLLWGGGALTYILRSNDAWYWPNQAVNDANHAVQTVIGPLVPGNNKPTAFLH
jgi:hypothetical protein